MALDWLFRWGWPEGIPRLYPELSDRQLAQFLDVREFNRIAILPQVTILPFASEASTEPEVYRGLGLQKLMIRDLMLVRDLSTRGPEDTPEIPLDVAMEHIDRLGRSILVGGTCQRLQDGWRAEVRLFDPRQSQTRHGEVREGDFHAFLQRLAGTIATACGGTVTDATRQMWRYGRPSSPATLLSLGRIHASFDDGDPARAEQGLILWQHDRSLVLALHLASEGDDDQTASLVQGFQIDPYDAQLSFLLGIALWKSSGAQPEVVQFCRRAIELSPGHGKAHMCAPHAAPRGVNMLLHSELGYRLLPGNPFAVNNFILNLQQAGAPAHRIIALAKEGIESDPSDPGNYDRLIEVCEQLGDYHGALAAAQQLQRLFEPRMNERTFECLMQNPRRAEMLKSGRYDPAAENRQRIAALRRKLRL